MTVGKATLKKHPGDDTRSLPTSASISAARNEFEAFEIYIYNDTGSNLQNIDVSASNLTSASGVIPASNIWLYREAYLYIGTQTSNNEVSPNQYWPDPLVPRRDEMFNEYRGGFQNFGPKDPSQAINCPLVSEGSFSSCNWIPPGENRVIFVDILVPKYQSDGVTKTPPGNYAGTISVTFNGGNAHAVPVTLQVYDFDLNSTAALRTFYNANLSVFNADIAHNGFDSRDMTTYNAWSKLYGRYLLDHRMSASMINGITVPYSSSGSNFANLDNTFGELFDGVTDARSRLKGAQETAIPYSWHAVNNVDQHAQWESHFKAKNWWSRTFDKICDEPPATCTWADLHNTAQSIHNNASTADFILMVTTDPKVAAPNDAAFASDIDMLTPAMPHVYNKDPDENGVFNQPWAGFQLDNGTYPPRYQGKLWWYQACGSHWCSPNHPIPAGSTADAYYRGWPDLVIDVNTAAVNRAFEWLAARYGIVGVHYYDVFQNTPFAWQSVYAFGGNGDGTLLYPGTPQHHNESSRFVVGIGGVDDVPVSSLRLKMMREGVEDYEYLNILKSRGDGTFADNTVEDLFQVARGTVPPPFNAGRITMDALYTSRAALAQRIVNGSNPPCNSSDCFNRPDSSILGPSWNTYSPALQISNNQATNGDVNTKAAQWLTSIGADQDVSVDCKVTGSGSNCGLMARWSDANNHYYAYLDAGLGLVALYRVQAATITQLGSAARTISANTYYHLRLLAQGTSLSVYFNNEAAAAIAVTDTGISGNYAGLHAFAGAVQSVWYADFDVRPAGSCTSNDCFSRPDSSTLGPNWNTYSPALQISNNQVTNGDVNTKAAQWLTPIGADQDVSVDCKVTGSGSNCGLMARWSDASNYYYAYLDAGLGVVALYRVQAGTITQLGSAARTISANTYYRLRILAQATSLSLYFNNEATAAIAVTDIAITGNYAGLHAFAGAVQSVWYADFDVKAVAVTYYTVSITKSGTGSGRVTSSQAPIDCGTSCSARVASGTSITLNAAPDSGSSFSAFSGGCTSTVANCTFVVSGDSTVDAAFAANDFSISASPTSASVAQGGTATYTVSTQVTGGAAQTVVFSASGLPTGATASFNPASVIAGGSSTMTVTVGSSTTPGTYGTISVVGTGTATTHSTNVALTVTAAASIVFRAMSTYSALSENTTNMRLTVPSSVQPNDVLIATVYVGDYSNPSLPAVTAPAGWTLVKQATHGSAGELLIYSRVATASDAGTTYSWTTTVWVGATCTLLAYSGVNTSSPVVDASAAQDNPSSGTTYSTPTTSTTANGDLLIGAWAAYRVAAGMPSWSTPTGMTRRTNFTNAGLLSMANADITQASAGTGGPFSATVTVAEGYALTALIALRPSSAPPPISFRGSSTYSIRSTSTMSIDLVVPSSVQANDLLIANVFAGDYVGGTLPTIAPPSGWTLVRQVTHGTAGVLQVYSHVATATDHGTTYSWRTNMWVGSASSMLAYWNASAIDVTAMLDNATGGTTYSTPQATTAASGDLLIATYAGYTQLPPTQNWSAPTGMVQRVFLNNTDRTSNGLLSMSSDDKIQPSAGNPGVFRSTASVTQGYALTAIVALKR